MTKCNVGQSLQKLLACAQIMSELSMARSSKVCNANFFVSRSADLHRVISASAERKHANFLVKTVAECINTSNQFMNIKTLLMLYTWYCTISVLANTTTLLFVATLCFKLSKT